MTPDEPSDQPRRVAVQAGSLRHTAALTVHLVRRELAVSNTMSVVGAGWPLLRQLAQLAVLVVVFSKVLPLGIPNYGVFVFSGLLGWSWFSSGLSAGASSVHQFRNLAMRPGFPTVILPIVTTAVPFVDVLVALPVLLAMLVIVGELHIAAPLLIPLLLLQGVFIIGLGWLLGAASVFFRDVPNIVALGLMLGFYLTPVYFDVSRVPEQYQWIVRLNPMAVMLEADRAVLLGTPAPPVENMVALAVLSGTLAVAGFVVFRRFAQRFADEL